MNKEQFLSSLSNHLDTLPDDERQRILEYYGEIIDDSIERGMGESEAVDSLGSIDAIVHDILGNESSKTDEFPHFSSALVPITATHEPLHSIFIKDPSADIKIRPCTASDGSCNIDFFPAECKDDYHISNEDGILSIRRIKPLKKRPKISRNFGLFQISVEENCKLTVNLPIAELRKLTIEGLNGDIDCNGVKNCAEIDVQATSGNIKFEEIECQTLSAQNFKGDLSLSQVTCNGEAKLATKSGDLSIEDSTFAGSMTGSTTNGDLKFEDSNCGGDLHLTTVSGDLSIDDCHCSGDVDARSANGAFSLEDSNCGGNLSMTSASGDLSVDNCNCSGNVSLQSANGDLELNDLEIVGNFKLHTTSGDVACNVCTADSLTGNTNNGTFNFSELTIDNSLLLNSVSGDIEFNDLCIHNGPAKITTNSGNISGDFRDSDYFFDVSSRCGDVEAPHSRGNVIVTVRSLSGDISLSC